MGDGDWACWRSPSCSVLRLKRARSGTNVVHADAGVKFSAGGAPGIEQCRPRACPQCQSASREPGRRLAVIGHGVRERQVRGPAAPGERPRVSVVLVRRFLCLVCGAVMTVVPEGVLAGRLFSGPAILLGLFLWGVRAQSQQRVREAINPRSGLRSRGWRALNRWTRAAQSTALWTSLPPASGGSGTVRQMAKAVVEQVWARRRSASRESLTADSAWRAASGP